MKLVNQTPAVVHVAVSDLEQTSYRYGFITAKVTFEVGKDGRTTIDDQMPAPIFEKDVKTELGLLPCDIVPRRDPCFEVIVLGKAYSGGRSQCMVEMTVGDTHRRLRVAGDRHWVSRADGPVMSEPQPFEAMPLSWEHAFGGSCECWIDAKSVIDLEHPANKYGRGLDAEKLAGDFGKAFEAPDGFPRLAHDYVRRLPNLEHPEELICHFEDAPRPYCWATVPADIGVRSQRAQEHFQRHGEPLSQEKMLEQLYHSAHPDWILPCPRIDSPVVLQRMTPDGSWGFSLPRLRVLADYELGSRRGTRELEPHLLMLLPEESRFYLVYRYFFTLEVTRDMARSFRIRLEEGWFQ